jgi:hypothetical protein
MTRRKAPPGIQILENPTREQIDPAETLSCRPTTRTMIEIDGLLQEAEDVVEMIENFLRVASSKLEPLLAL